MTSAISSELQQNYEDLLDQVMKANLFSSAKLGLENTKQLHEAIGSPSERFKSIHVAGSNGKGSVCFKIAKGLESSGKKVGLFVSPHLFCFRERVTINGVKISEERTVAHLSRIFEKVEELNISATFFEITTLLAFAYFAEEEVDYAVIETGLGGRLDCTNILSPIYTVITSLCMEHTKILGDTIDDIAREKAGIIKDNTPLLLGPNAINGEVLKQAKRKKAPLISLKESLSDFEKENQAIAKATLKDLAERESIEVNLEALGHIKRPPCRLQILKPEDVTTIPEQYFPSGVVLDVAHNPGALEKLFTSLEKTFPNKPFRVVTAFSGSSDIYASLQVILKYTQSIHFAEIDHPRLESVLSLQAALIELGCPYMQKVGSVKSTLIRVFEQAHFQNEVVVICGSFFIMKEVWKALGMRDQTFLD